MPINEIGDRQNKLRKNGYYYQTLEIETYPYYKNSYGGYSQDSTKPYKQIRLYPIILFANGSTINYGSFSGLAENSAFNFGQKCNLTDSNTLQSSIAHFECYMQNLPPLRLNFINKKAEIWNQGIFQVSNNEIRIQIFYNSIGNYYLYEKTGKVINDSTFSLSSVKDFQNGKEEKITEIFKFHEMNNLPVISSYILNHKSKFN